jgi:hypothetical protein
MGPFRVYGSLNTPQSFNMHSTWRRVLSLIFGPLFAPSIALLAITLFAPLSKSKHDRTDESNSHFCVLTRCENVNWIQLAPSKFLHMKHIFFSDGQTNTDGMSGVRSMRGGGETYLYWCVCGEAWRKEAAGKNWS